MAKPISQSDTQWIKKGEKLPNGKTATKGTLIQRSTGKVYTGKVKIVKEGSTSSINNVASYRKGRNVTLNALETQKINRPKSKPTASKPSATKTSVTKTATRTGGQEKPPATKTGAAPQSLRAPAASSQYVSPGTAAARSKWAGIDAQARKRGAGAGRAYEERKASAKAGQRPKRPKWEPEVGQSAVKGLKKPLLSVAEKKKMRDQAKARAAREAASRAAFIAQLKAKKK